MRANIFLKKMILPVALLSSTAVYAGEVGGVGVENKSHTEFQGGWLDLKPMSNNHTYAFYVAGNQPEFQDWHAQTVDPSYASAFELGFLYNMKESTLNLGIDWLHLNSNNSASKQGNQTINPTQIEFTGPPFEMSPPVFGIRYAGATLKYNYDTIALNLEKMFVMSEAWMSAKIIGGINILRVKQDFSTTFSDLVGSLSTPYTYPLPPDPSFSFNIHSISEFLGIGPNLGLSGRLELFKGLSIIGTASGSLNAGTTSIQENFRSTSERLTLQGIGVSKQQIPVPNKTQVVPGFDGKLGLIYKFKNRQILDFSIEGGYRLISYMNAISTITPQTLVQPGQNPTIPEFSTGTMAIVSMLQQDRPFNLNGPYVTLKLDVM